MISDLLTFSKVTEAEPRKEPVDLNKLIAEIEEDLAATIQEHSAVVIYSDLPIISADRTQMRQLFQNLMTNSLKFRKPDTSPRIEITAQEGHQNGSNGATVISISDNGIGFDAEAQGGRIFQIFHRLHQKEFEGSGIGLSICKKIVRRHGGEIRAHSKVGEGTRFEIILPS